MAVAAMTMVLSGFFQVVEGIAALSQNEIFLASIGYLFWLDLPVWGGIHVAMGVLLMAAGFTLRTAKLWSRVVGIAFAGLSMIANFLFLPYYPIWSSVIIGFDVIVIGRCASTTGTQRTGERMVDLQGLVDRGARSHPCRLLLTPGPSDLAVAGAGPTRADLRELRR